MEAARLKLDDLTIEEWSRTDAQWWHEMAAAMSAWINGKAAGGAIEQDRKELAKQVNGG